MLKHGDTCFLDDMTLEALAQQLAAPLLVVTDVENLLETCVRLSFDGVQAASLR
jgi:NifB/MoaA-like Fe-S oxidoreductase